MCGKGSTMYGAERRGGLADVRGEEADKGLMEQPFHLVGFSAPLNPTLSVRQPSTNSSCGLVSLYLSLRLTLFPLLGAPECTSICGSSSNSGLRSLYPGTPSSGSTAVPIASSFLRRDRYLLHSTGPLFSFGTLRRARLRASLSISFWGTLIAGGGDCDWSSLKASSCTSSSSSFSTSNTHSPSTSASTSSPSSSMIASWCVNKRCSITGGGVGASGNHTGGFISSTGNVTVISGDAIETLREGLTTPPLSDQALSLIPCPLGESILLRERLSREACDSSPGESVCRCREISCESRWGDDMSLTIAGLSLLC
mmetsp:Transcript_3378/g.5119  ORF Transcript_3378/g.5119 Transcript_3378/m.5119 type:complete len:312 (+) Transcript_3378:665-1600(+)